jgi:C1A family cysteine protease
MNILTCIIVSVVILTIIILTALLSYFLIHITTSAGGNYNDNSGDNSYIKLGLNPINGYILPYVNILNVPDQDRLKSCGAVQLSTLMSYYYYMQLNNTITMSALYLYYYGRMINGGNINVDNGSSINDYLSSINTFGLTTENDWPYITNKYNIQPLQNNITIYNPELRWNTETTNITNIKHSIKNGNPVILDIILYTSFSNTNASGLVIMPNITNESYIAHHAISLWGWNDDYNVFIILNSWGTSKGYNGWFFLPYDYLVTPALSTRFVYNISFIKDFNNIH